MINTLTPLLEDAPRILFHVRGSMQADEVDMLVRLRHALRARRFELLVIAHFWPEISADVPVLRVRNGLSHYVSPTPDQGWRPWLSPQPSLDKAFLSELLAIEDDWNGPVSDESPRMEAIWFYEIFYRTALSQAKPSLLLLWNGRHPQEKILDRLCRDTGCPVCYLERGLLPGVLHIDTEGILAASRIARSTAWTWPDGVDSARWKNTFAAFQRGYCKGGNTWWTQPKSSGADALRRELEIPSSAKVLMFAGQVDRDAQNLYFSPLYKNNLTAFEAFCAALPRDPAIFVLGKHHPKSEISPMCYREVLARHGLAGVWAENCALTDCLALADRVAAVNSTVLAESLMHGKPVLAMGNLLLSGKGIAYENTGDNALAEVVREWIAAADQEFRLKRWLDFGAYLLASEFYGVRADAEAHGLRGIDAMAAHLISQCAAEVSYAAPPAGFLEEALLWDDLRRKFHCHTGFKEVLRGLNIVANATIGRWAPGAYQKMVALANRWYGIAGR